MESTRPGGHIHLGLKDYRSSVANRGEIRLIFRQSEDGLNFSSPVSGDSLLCFNVASGLLSPSGDLISALNSKFPRTATRFVFDHSAVHSRLERADRYRKLVTSPDMTALGVLASMSKRPSYGEIDDRIFDFMIPDAQPLSAWYR